MSDPIAPPHRSIGERLNLCVKAGYITHAEAVSLSSIIGNIILIHDSPKHADHMRGAMAGLSKQLGVNIIGELRSMYHSSSDAIKHSRSPFPSQNGN